MPDSKGFWSYVHLDDEAEGSRITRLAKDVTTQFEMLTGEPISLFVDRDALSWGDNWRDLVDSRLVSVAFFIPVMTPRYFMSPECRRELQLFAREAVRLGVKELVLPLLYVEVASLHDESCPDDLIRLVRQFQWEDWRDLRFAEPSSEGYRRGVARMAQRLVDVNRNLERTDAAIPEPSVDGGAAESIDDSPGVLDLMANFEGAIPEATATLAAIKQSMDAIAEATRGATTDLERGNQQGKGFAFRQAAAKRLASSLAEPVERVFSLGNAFASQFHSVDEGIRAIIERAGREIEREPDARSTICSFFDQVRSLSGTVRHGLTSMQSMLAAMATVERMSRDLRRVLRRLRQGLTTFIEASEVCDEWVRLIDRSSVRCEPAAVAEALDAIGRKVDSLQFKVPRESGK